MSDTELNQILQDARRSLSGLSKRAHRVTTYSKREGPRITVGVEHRDAPPRNVNGAGETDPEAHAKR